MWLCSLVRHRGHERWDFLKSEITQNIWVFLTKLFNQIIFSQTQTWLWVFSQIWDFLKPACHQYFFSESNEKKNEISQEILKLVNSNPNKLSRELTHQICRQKSATSTSTKSNPLEGLNENEIFERYPFSPDTIYFKVDLLKYNLLVSSRRNNLLIPHS